MRQRERPQLRLSVCPAVCQLALKLCGSEMFQLSLRGAGRVAVRFWHAAGACTHQVSEWVCPLARRPVPAQARQGRVRTLLISPSQEAPTHCNFQTPSLPPSLSSQPTRRPQVLGRTQFRDSSFPPTTSRKSPTSLEILNQQPPKARPCGPRGLPSSKRGEPFLGGEQRSERKESAPFLTGSLLSSLLWVWGGGQWWWRESPDRLPRQEEMEWKVDEVAGVSRNI